ncbi:MAG: DegV family protein [Clostridia bacterium]|nr:DegV family protein [Clostridia bacterium]
MFKIVTDSSSNMRSMEKTAFASAPLKIVTDEREFVDTETLDVLEMVEYLKGYKGRSGSACPSSDDWLSAFGDAQYVFCIAITSHLSGSYNSARLAAEDYMEQHPDRKVFVIDSLSTAGEMQLIAERIEALIEKGLSFEEICSAVTEYMKKTHLLFCLESLTNLVNNGRVSAAAAKISGLLNLRIVGKASDQGELEMLDKSRGDKGGRASIVKNMKDMGYEGGRVIIGHCAAKERAHLLADAIRAEFAEADISIGENGGLCSFYAENGGLLVGFESK